MSKTKYYIIKQKIEPAKRREKDFYLSRGEKFI